VLCGLYTGGYALYMTVYGVGNAERKAVAKAQAKICEYLLSEGQKAQMQADAMPVKCDELDEDVIKSLALNTIAITAKELVQDIREQKHLQQRGE